MKTIIKVIVVGAVLGVVSVYVEFVWLNGVTSQLESEMRSTASYVALSEYYDGLGVQPIHYGLAPQPALGAEWVQGGEDNTNWVLQ